MSSDFDALDAASEKVELGPSATQSHSIGNYGSAPLATPGAPDRADAKMPGVPPEQWAKPIR